MSESKIIKAEILLSRKCNLGCKYCRIVREDRKTASLEDWKRILDNLKELGCIITPIYGAEPTLEWDLLLGFIEYTEKIGIRTTVITNGILLSKDKDSCNRVGERIIEGRLKELYSAGLRSITTSIDSLSPEEDDSIKRRRDAALLLIDRFKSLPDIRDIEVSVTLTRKNLVEFPSLVHRFSLQKIWTSFDIIHWSERGHGYIQLPDSKCEDYDNIRDLVLGKDLSQQVLQTIRTLKRQKEEGVLLHQSSLVLSMLEQERYWRDLSWSCEGKDMGFVTIDCDGSVANGCDDFNPLGKGRIKGWELLDKWKEFEEERERLVKEYGCQCCWGTHVMSKEQVGTKEGVQNFLHIKENNNASTNN